jgi:hypothetical protein
MVVGKRSQAMKELPSKKTRVVWEQVSPGVVREMLVEDEVYGADFTVKSGRVLAAFNVEQASAEQSQIHELLRLCTTVERPIESLISLFLDLRGIEKGREAIKEMLKQEKS